LARAWSRFEIKALDEAERIIEGIATTPDTDRAGDIVEPLGAKYDLPIPFLWQHEGREASIGDVVFAKPTKDGIPVRIQIAKDDVPGPLKDRLDYAWRSIVKGRVRGLSVGFTPLEEEPIKGTYGIRYKRWAWHELSAVTIPANADATISLVKSLDEASRAASGPLHTPPGVSGFRVKMTQPKPQGGAVNVQEKIKGFEATRQSKAAEMVAIMEKSTDETLDAAQKDAWDTLELEVKELDGHLGRLRQMEKLSLEKAQPVPPTPKANGEREPNKPAITVKAAHEPGAGIRFARVIKAIGVAHKKHRDVGLVAAQMYPDDALVQKAAVGAGATVSGNWAANLVGEEGGVFADFVEFLRPQTILGQFGTNGIPDLRRVPFRTPLVGQTAGGDGYWVGEGKPKPLTKFAFGRTTLEPLKVANIAVLTEELLMSSSPAAESIVRDSLAAALRERLDIDFIDPEKVADSGVSPASITNGVTAIPSSGNDADAVRADVQALMATFIAAHNPPTSGVWIMSATRALALGQLRTALGAREFDGVTMRGGTFEGLPVIVSEYIPTDDYTDIVVLANASDIYLGDEGGIQVDVSREASLQMDDAPPTQNALTGTGISLVSLWQTNSVGFRAERIINWALRRESAVAVLEGVAWGQA
jgi:HK97 family phage major capsid protein